MRLLKAMVILAALAAPIASAIPSRNQPRPQPALTAFPKPIFYDFYQLPFRGMETFHRISSGFGVRRHPIFGGIHGHAGLDFPKPYGTPVYPSREGYVEFAGWKGGYGRVVELRHRDGGMTIYGHLARYFVSKGEKVGKDKLLGLVGSSGYSTGPHLHFETRTPSGRPFDPRYIITRR